MMHLKLYQLKQCDDYKIDKLSYLTQLGSELTGDLKENCDISSPVITLKCPKDASDNNIIDFNYCYITEFKRYYFINSITFGMNDIITISCSCDVLYSFKDVPSGVTEHWMNSSLYCTRRTNGSALIQDNLRSFKYKKVVSDVTSSFVVPSGTTSRSFDVNGAVDTSYRVVISIINQTTWQGKLNNLAFLTKSSVGNLPSLTCRSNGDELASNYYLITIRSLATIIDECVHNDELKSFIKSIIVLPYAPEYTTNWPYITPEGQQPSHTKNLLYGTGGAHFVALPDDIGFPLYSNYDRFVKEYRDVPSGLTYMDYDPYTKIRMYIPYKDHIELNLDSVRGCRLALIYYVNYDDGIGDVILYNTTKNIVEYQSSCQLGVKIGISSSNELEITNQKIQLGITTAISTISSILAIASGNPLVAMGGAVGLVGGLASNVSKANALLTMGETAISSGNVGVINNQNVQFIQTKYEMVITTNADENLYESDKGLPFNNYLAITNATTNEYLQFDDDNVPLDNRMTKNEFNTLIELLKKGVRK